MEAQKNFGSAPRHVEGGKGPHLLRDRKGNTAYCGGAGLCELCDKIRRSAIWNLPKKSTTLKPS